MPSRLLPFGSMKRWQLIVMLVVLAVHVMAGLMLAQTPSQDSINGRNRQSMDDLNRRIALIEGDHTKVAVLESDMAEIKWMQRGILGCFGFYLFTLLTGGTPSRPLSLLDRRREKPEIEP